MINQSKQHVHSSIHINAKTENNAIFFKKISLNIEKAWMGKPHELCLLSFQNVISSLSFDQSSVLWSKW